MEFTATCKKTWKWCTWILSNNHLDRKQELITKLNNEFKHWCDFKIISDWTLDMKISSSIWFIKGNN